MGRHVAEAMGRHVAEAMGRQTDLVLDASLPKHKNFFIEEFFCQKAIAAPMSQFFGGHPPPHR